jgi:hypothetical protein
LALSCQQSLIDKAAANPKGAEKDANLLYQIMLEWAVLNKPLPGQTEEIAFPDRGLIQDTPVIYVSTDNLPSDVRLSLPDKTIQVLPEEELQKIADQERQFPAFRFTELKAAEDAAELGLDLVWFVPEKAQVFPLSGGGVQMRFRWQEGSWKFEKPPIMSIS